MYDPFAPGSFAVAERTIEARDDSRARSFPCDIWIPQTGGDESGPWIVYSHSSGTARRRMARYLCKHLCGHGYRVATMDHSETFAPEVKGVDAILDNRVRDVRFLLDYLGVQSTGLVGHSIGGWTVLAVTEADQCIRAVVAIAPAGSTIVRPGILPASLNFEWGRQVPALYLAAENDTMIPLEAVRELYGRAPEPKRLAVLRRSDHLHFMEDAEREHEAARTMEWPEHLAWLPKEMLPIAELCTGAQAHTFVAALTLAHFDAVIKGADEAQQFLDGDLHAELHKHGVETLAAR